MIKGGTVTKDGWCVSYQTGHGIPNGLCKLSVFRGDSFVIGQGHTVRGDGDGELMTKEDGERHCLEKGYLQRWNETDNFRNLVEHFIKFYGRDHAERYALDNGKTLEALGL